MPKTVKEHLVRWMPVAAACAVLIGGALWAGTLLPHEEGTSAARSEPTTPTTAFLQFLGERDGVLTRFAADGETVLEVYEVPIASLPAEEQARLASGIPVTDEAALSRWLEAYTG